MARNRRSGEPLLSLVGSWVVLGASFALSADTWIALAELAGFTRTITFPGSQFTFVMAWLMPLCVDGYVVVALTLWMSPVPAKVAKFAKVNTYFAASIGIAAQSVYHLLMTMSNATEDWHVPLAAVVGAFPPALAGLAIHMRALIRRESHSTTEPATPKPSRVAGLISTIGQIRHAINDNITNPGHTAVPPHYVDTAATSTIPTTPFPTTNSQPSTVDPSSAVPANLPGPAPTSITAAPIGVSVPSPAEVAERITGRPQANPRPNPASVPGQVQRTARPRTSTPPTPAPRLTPSSTDLPVTATQAVQPPLPMVDPDLLAQATEVARQYHAEHGTRINAGQLAVRIHKDTKTAALLLQAIQTTDNTPTTKPTDPTVNSVNGTPVKAIR